MDLRKRWFALRPRYARNREWSITWDLLYKSYEAPGRFYHTLEHVYKCFTWYDEVAHLLDDPIAVALAIWFHDIEYNTKAKDNEEKSAAVLLALAPALKLDTAVAEKAAMMILQTKKHDPDGLDDDTKVFLDVDLAILGAPRDEYAAYARSVRREYGWVPDEMYREGRKAVLESFLARPRIFQTEPFQHLEAAARDNIQWEMTSLSEENPS